MNIGGHGLRDHLRLLVPSFGLVGAVWALRLVLDAAGISGPLLRVCSVSVAGPVSILLAVLLIHLRRFGSYPNAVLAAFLLACWQQFLVSVAIAFTIATGINNIYATPEHSAGLDPWHHILAHLTLGVGSETLLGTLAGCLLLGMLRWLVPLTLPKGSSNP